MARTPESTRSFALAGHGGSGKTALIEAMLFDNGNITRMGKADSGNMVSDFSAEEQKRQISISTSLITMERSGKTLFCLDSPGFADFAGEMTAALTVADTAIIVLSAVSGIEVQTNRAWDTTCDTKTPAVFYMSRMDRENADFDKVLMDIQTEFSDRALPVLIPIGKETNLKGVVNVLKNKAYLYPLDGSGKFQEADVPAEMHDAVNSARESITEAVVEVDDALMERYLEGGEIDETEFFNAMRKAIAERKFFPVAAGASTANVGIHQLLDFIVDHFPSPLETPTLTGIEGENKITVKADPAAPFSSCCFKIMVDPYVGKLSYIRVVSGTLAAEGNSIFNAARGEEERISSFKFMCGKEGKDVKEIMAGDILALPKIQSTKVGDTLTQKGGAKWTFPAILFPKPVYSVAVVAKSRADEDKLGNAIARTLEEDPSLTFEKNIETHDSVLSGMGDMHIGIVLAKMKERYGVDLDTRTPQVPYRETIRKTAEAQGKHKKQTGGRGQFGDVYIRYIPLSRGEGFVFDDKITGGAIPNNYIPAVEKGLREYMLKGPLAGFPVVDFRAELYFGSYHDVDSSELSFKLATRLSFKKGVMDANPVLLEPIMNVEVIVPEQYLGDVMGDFNSRRGRIGGTDSHGKLQVVKAQAPLAEMFRYAIILRSMTSGQGNFSMSHSHYEEVPPDIAKKIIAAHKQEEEEE